MLGKFRIQNCRNMLKKMSLCALVITVTFSLGLVLLLSSTMKLNFTNEMTTQDQAFAQNQINDSSPVTTADPTNRTFYLENSEIDDLNQTKLGIPPDVFSLPQMAVEQGDNAIIHFYNLEDLGGDNHSFTLIDGPYNINKELAPQKNATITFNANQTGIFKYICVYHPPTMTGQLVVLPKQ